MASYLCASVQELGSLLEEFARNLGELLKYVLVVEDGRQYL